MTTVIILSSLIILLGILWGIYKLSRCLYKSKYRDSQDNFRSKPNAVIIFLVFLSILLVGLSVYAPFIFTREAPTDDFDFLTSGQIGDTIGGITSPFINLAAVILTALAFYMQYRANKIQVEIFKIQLEKTKEQFEIEVSNQKADREFQQFESQFYEMLRLHKENVNELEVDFPFRDPRTGEWGTRKIAKRETFTEMSKFIKRILNVAQIGINTVDENKYYLAYELFYWGFDKNKLYELTSPAQKVMDSKQEISQLENLVHDGFSSFLGHYFRHLFLMVKFVDESKAIKTFEDKMKYLKIVRAQLSNHEQIMLFYNWLCTGYGDAWEENSENGRHFFTQYKMIHNLWAGELFESPFITHEVNKLIDIYNLNKGGSPLFEFQGNDFYKKI